MIAHRCSASCEPSRKKALEQGIPYEELATEPESIAIQRADELLYRILNDTQAEEHRIFIGGSENFRTLLYPEYKANRRDLADPTHLASVREFLVREWGAEVVSGYESDDGIGIAAKGDFVIVSNDKDFKQIAGEHYNPINLTWEVVDDETAALRFFCQMLEGDRSDNVAGIDGLGPVKSKRILDGRSIEEMHSEVRRIYADDERFLLNLRLLRILRDESELEEIYADIKREKQGEEPTKACSSPDPETLSEAN